LEFSRKNSKIAIHGHWSLRAIEKNRKRTVKIALQKGDSSTLVQNHGILLGYILGVLKEAICQFEVVRKTVFHSNVEQRLEMVFENASRLNLFGVYFNS
jgi:hypothetical protein